MTRRPVDRNSKGYRFGYAAAPWVCAALLAAGVAWIMWGGH